MATLIDVQVPFHPGHHQDLRDSRSRILGPPVDPSVLIPPPSLPQLLSRPCPVESPVQAGLQGRVPPPAGGRNQRLSLHSGRTLLADAARRGGRASLRGRSRTRPTLTRQQHAQQGRCPPTSSARRRSTWAEGGAPVPASLRSLFQSTPYVITHSAYSSCQMTRPLPQAAFPTSR